MLQRLKLDITELSENSLSYIGEHIWESDVSTFCDPHMAGGQFIVEVVNKLREYGHSDDNIKSRVFGYAENELYLSYVKSKYEEIATFDIYNENMVKNMKFDVILGNPPWSKKVGPNKTQPIWASFVENTFDMCKSGGYIFLIHPSGWRNVGGNYSKINKLITTHDLKYLSVNSYDAGRKVFGVSISYDCYVIKNTKVNATNTTIQFEDTLEKNVDVKKLKFIPTAGYEQIQNLIAKDGEETVNILYSSSAYEIRNHYMSKEKTDKFIYPCVYTITKGSDINLYYSNTNKNGHFGIPKVIWTNGLGTYPINDDVGQYGLTQYAYAIVDEPKNLPHIKQALDNDEFKNLMKISITNDAKYDRKVISLFRKDFWKEFI